MRSNNGQPTSQNFPDDGTTIEEAMDWMTGTLQPPEPPEEPKPEGPIFKHFAPGEIAEFKRQSKLRRK